MRLPDPPAPPHRHAQEEWRGEVRHLSWRPRAFLYKGFLSDAECEHIKALVGKRGGGGVAPSGGPAGGAVPVDSCMQARRTAVPHPCMRHLALPKLFAPPTLGRRGRPWRRATS